jgi:hypothetical protein
MAISEGTDEMGIRVSVSPLEISLWGLMPRW